MSSPYHNFCSPETQKIELGLGGANLWSVFLIASLIFRFTGAEKTTGHLVTMASVDDLMDDLRSDSTDKPQENEVEEKLTSKNQQAPYRISYQHFRH